MSQESSVSETPPAPPLPKWTWAKLRRAIIRRLMIWSILLTLYVLSIGPMYWVWYSGMYVSTKDDYWVIVFYEPLRLACQIEWIDSIVTAYIEWWIL